MKRVVAAVIAACLGLVVLLDYGFGRDYRSRYQGGKLNETFLRGGTLGELLKQAGFVGITNDSHGLALKDGCAEKQDLKGYDFQYKFRLRVHVDVDNKTHLTLTVAVGPKGKQIKFVETIEAIPEKQVYFLYFEAKPDQPVFIRYRLSQHTQGILEQAWLEGRFHRKYQLVGESVNIKDNVLILNNQPLPKTFSNGPIKLEGALPELTQQFPEGLKKSFYSGVFPGKKNKGYCSWENMALTHPDGKTPSPNEAAYVLPKVSIQTDAENLYGESGIIDNKQQKGIRWEKPATLRVYGRTPIAEQRVGLRFHGGTPGRKRDIQSFRLYARNRLGKPEINAAAIFGKKAQTGVKSLVLKYTYQVVGEQHIGNAGVIDFNPFIHALALDIGERIGAIVPRHTLVDLEINGEAHGMHLAMEHFSPRTISHWLDDAEYKLYTYKSKNALSVSVPIFKAAKDVLMYRGEAAFERLKHYYDIDNVINSILLTAYIGDDDYCQGAELMRERPDGTTEITSLNWDLDHAFFRTVKDELKILHNKGGTKLIYPRKGRGCTRQWSYAWTFMQSARFRDAVKSRMEELLNTVLHPRKADEILHKYSQINALRFDGKYTKQIDDLKDFIQFRPDILRNHLKEVEDAIANIDTSTINW